MKNSIVLIPFPFDDFLNTKVRPAICFTHVFGKYNHIVVAFISSNLNIYTDPSDILVLKNEAISHKTGLKTDSVIKLNRMVTLPNNLIQRKLGEANEMLQAMIRTQLINIFELE